MKKKLLLLSLGLFGGLAVPTIQVAQATPVTMTQRLNTPDYISGYTTGSDDARFTKCDYRGNQSGYIDWYYSRRATAANNRDEAARTGDVLNQEYWSGYYDGLEEGYNLPALCSGTGGGGGPFEPEPVNEN